MVNPAVLWWRITTSCQFFLLFPLISLDVKCTFKCKMYSTEMENYKIVISKANKYINKH